MTDITIPPEAGARALALFRLPNCLWDDLDHEMREYLRGDARAAFLAMMKAWPDTAKGYSSTWWGQRTLMLPIGEEKPDAE